MADNRKFTWRRSLLIGSLLLNVLVVGAAAGFFANGWHKTPSFEHRSGGQSVGRRGPSGPPILSSVLREMDRSEARDFVRSIRNAQQAEGLDQSAVRTFRQSLAAGLVKDPFDADAVANLLTQQRQDQSRRAEVAHRVLMQQIASLSVAQRTAIAQHLLRERSGRRNTDN